MPRGYLNIQRQGNRRQLRDTMQKYRMKYTDEMICFQEVPDETTLSFSISNCPHHCDGCHSAYLADDIGIPLLGVIRDRLEHYKGLITCVLFMGGDDEKQIEELKECSSICKEYGVKTALYSGADSVPNELYKLFDYIKIGHYDKNCGGLNCKTTNQRMFKKRETFWEDITHRFWKK